MARNNSLMAAEGQQQRTDTVHSAGQMMARGTSEAQKEGFLLFKITGESSFLRADMFFTTTFTALNGSGVTGEAIVAYDLQTRTVTVAVSASGLEANQVHLQHIHGFADGTNATTPTISQDADGDGYVELAEGLPSYGPVLLNLATDHRNAGGTDNGHDHGNFAGSPTAPEGEIWFIEQYRLAANDPLTMGSFDLREIVIHGMTVPEDVGEGTPGEVDGSGGYEILLPVASAELTQVSTFAALSAFIDATDFNTDAAMARADYMFG